MAESSATQYVDSGNLEARQTLWTHVSPLFRLSDWVLDLIGHWPDLWVLDVGCGNGTYLSACRDRGAQVVGCDLSFGMLQSARHDALVNADVMALPFASESLDVVLAPHMLYEVSDVEGALLEVRRVLKPGGVLLAVTNGSNHARSLRALVEESVRDWRPGWVMFDPATRRFSLENGASQLGRVFDSISCVRPDRSLRVILRDANVAANFVASVGDRYESEIGLPWTTIVDEVRRKVRQIIGDKGSFVTSADVGVFVCR